MPPYETYALPTHNGNGRAGEANALADRITQQYETVAKRGGQVVAQFVVEVTTATHHQRVPHVFITAEFPESYNIASD